MGNAVATNRVNSTINVFYNILTSATQDCSTQLLASQIVNIVNSQHVDVTGNNFQQYYNINVACLQSTSSTNQIDTEITTAIQQQAQAINQAVNFNPGSTEANNVTTLVTNLGIAIKNEFLQNCSAIINTTQGINVQNSSYITVKYNNFDQTLNLMRQCTMNSTVVNNIRTQLIEQISQSAIAKVESILPSLLFLLVLAAAVVYLFMNGWQKIFDPVFLCAIALLILLVLVLDYFLKWWPYRSVSNDQPVAEQASNKRWNTILLSIVVGLIVVDVVLMIVFLRAKASKSTTNLVVSPAALAKAAPFLQ